MRTIVDIPEEQRRRLAEYCEAEHVSRAEAIRRAVDLLIEDRRSKREERLALIEATAGLWRDRGVSTDEYLEKLRAEWDR